MVLVSSWGKERRGKGLAMASTAAAIANGGGRVMGRYVAVQRSPGFL